jgi:hypothetical protein
MRERLATNGCCFRVAGWTKTEDDDEEEEEEDDEEEEEKEASSSDIEECYGCW